jgi:hypothetical protein
MLQCNPTALGCHVHQVLQRWQRRHLQQQVRIFEPNPKLQPLQLLQA